MDISLNNLVHYCQNWYWPIIICVFTITCLINRCYHGSFPCRWYIAGIKMIDLWYGRVEPKSDYKKFWGFWLKFHPHLLLFQEALILFLFPENFVIYLVYSIFTLSWNGNIRIWVVHILSELISNCCKKDIKMVCYYY